MLTPENFHHCILIGHALIVTFRGEEENMMNCTRYAKWVLLLAGVVVSIAYAAEPTKRSAVETKKVSKLTSQDYGDFSKFLKEKLDECSLAFVNYKLSLVTARQKARLDAEMKLLNSGNYTATAYVDDDALQKKLAEIEPRHIVCSEGAKEEAFQRIRPLNARTKSEKLREQMKQMLAQWITATDSIGTSSNEMEKRKFETLANQFQIEVQLVR